MQTKSQKMNFLAVLVGSISALSLASVTTASANAGDPAVAAAKLQAEINVYAKLAKTAQELQNPDAQRQIKTAIEQKIDQFTADLGGLVTGDRKKLATDLNDAFRNHLDDITEAFTASQNGGGHATGHGADTRTSTRT